MLRPSWKHILVVAVAALALTIVSQSYACCGWGCGCSGWYGGGYGCGGCGWGCGYTSCAVGCTPCCDLTLGCRPGPVRRLVLGPCKWYGGGYGYGWGWNGCYSSCACCGDCSFGCGCGCGCLPYYTPTMGCCGGCGTIPGMAVPATGTPTPAVKPATPPAPGAAPETPPAPAPTVPAPTTTPAAPAPTPGTTGVPSLEDSALLTVYVPYEAKITINGLPTQSTGSRRQYASFGLQPGMSYKYDVHVEIVREGKIVEEDKTVTLTAGQQDALAFGFNVKPGEGVASAQ